jgi:hypothetical protein
VTTRQEGAVRAGAGGEGGRIGGGGGRIGGGGGIHLAGESDEAQFWELVVELDMERAIGESVVGRPATTQVTTQDEEVRESEQDELAEEEPELAAKVIELLTAGKGKRKVAPTWAKVYREVDGLVRNLSMSSSICANTYAHSVYNASHGRPSQSASPHPMSGAVRSARHTRVSAPGGGRVTRSLRVRWSSPTRGPGGSWCLRWMSCQVGMMWRCWRHPEVSLTVYVCS